MAPATGLTQRGVRRLPSGVLKYGTLARVKLSRERILEACRDRGLGLGDLLSRAGVSRTAYYQQLRKDSVLPRSILALAAALSVPPSALLDETELQTRRARSLMSRLESILAAHPGTDRDNVWHTLILLEQAPIDRLNRGLLRGRAAASH